MGYTPVMHRDIGGFDEHQSCATPVFRPDLAAEGARVAARLIRDQRLRGLLAAIAEFWRASGPDRRYWRGQGLFLIREWRRLCAVPEREAFQRAVAASKRRAAA